MKSENNLKNNMFLLIRTTIPLIGGSLSGMVMLIANGLCLSRYSEETLAASGPAVFNASLIITLFTGIVGITRAFVGQANGSKDKWEIGVTAISGVIMAIILGCILIVIKPFIVMLPDLSNRREEIKILEKEFLSYVPYYGFFMILNTAFASILNGILKFKTTMIVGIIINILNVFLTIGFVFGYFIFPELGISGSAIGSFVSSLIATIVYLVILIKSNLLKEVKNKRRELYQSIKKVIPKMFQVGIFTGVAQTLDEAAQTLFVWIVGGISFVGLMANNIALSINYIMVIPLSGLGIGTSILIANKIGSEERESIKEIIKAAFALSFLFILIVFIMEYLFARNLAMIFMPKDAVPELILVATNIIIFLFTYGIGFAFSMIFGGALEAAGLAKNILWTRLILEFVLCLPIIYIVVQNNVGNHEMIKLCWIIYSTIELMIGLIYGVIFMKNGVNQKRLIDKESVN